MARTGCSVRGDGQGRAPRNVSPAAAPAPRLRRRNLSAILARRSVRAGQPERARPDVRLEPRRCRSRRRARRHLVSEQRTAPQGTGTTLSRGPGETRRGGAAGVGGRGLDRRRHGRFRRSRVQPRSRRPSRGRFSPPRRSTTSPRRRADPRLPSPRPPVRRGSASPSSVSPAPPTGSSTSPPTSGGATSRSATCCRRDSASASPCRWPTRPTSAP